MKQLTILKLLTPVLLVLLPLIVTTTILADSSAIAVAHAIEPDYGQTPTQLHQATTITTTENPHPLIVADEDGDVSLARQGGNTLTMTLLMGQRKFKTFRYCNTKSDPNNITADLAWSIQESFPRQGAEWLETIIPESEVIPAPPIGQTANCFLLTSVFSATNLPRGSYNTTITFKNATTNTVPPAPPPHALPDVTMNVELEVVCGDKELADRFAPVMYFHDDEKYKPIAVDLPLQHADLVQYDSAGNRQVLKSGPLTSADLLSNNSSDTYIDFWGNGSDGMLETYNSFKNSTRPSAYARFYCPSEPHPEWSDVAVVIQYWFFYFDNPWRIFDFTLSSRHEGDWEMVQVLLDENYEPLYAGYSQHYGGDKIEWSDIERESDNPVVYVAENGHGSYFDSDSYSYLCATDDTYPATRYDGDGDGGINTILLSEKDDDGQSWLNFKGHWGEREGGTSDNSGPLGPRWRTMDASIYPCIPEEPGGPSLWDDPIVWFDALEWDFYPGHVYNQISVIVSDVIEILGDIGPNILEVSGGKENQTTNSTISASEIPSAKYYDNETTGTRALVVHDPVPNALYEITLTTDATQIVSSEPISVQVRYPDSQREEVFDLVYILPSTWNVASKATLKLYPNSDFKIELDLNGDGTIDEVAAPDTIESTPIPFLAIETTYLPMVLK